MTTHPATSPVTPSVAPTAVDFRCPCIACGYDLEGIALASRCPECGARVSASYQGPTLDRCDPAWVRTLARGQAQLAWAGTAWTLGAVLLCAAYLAMAFNAFENWRDVNRVAVFTIAPCLVAGFTLLVSGGVMVTTPERTDAEALPARMACRALLWLILALGGVMAVVALVFPLRSANATAALLVFDGLLIALGASSLLLALKGSAYLSRLAVRTGAARLGLRVRTAAQSLAVLAGVASLAVVPTRIRVPRWSEADERIYILGFGVLVAGVLISAGWLSALMHRLAHRMRYIHRRDRP